MDIFWNYTICRSVEVRMTLQYTNFMPKISTLLQFGDEILLNAPMTP